MMHVSANKLNLLLLQKIQWDMTAAEYRLDMRFESAEELG